MSRPSEPSDAGDEAVSVDLRLRVGSYGLKARLSAPAAPVKPRAVLPALQALVDVVVEASLRTLQDEGRRASCATGCAACCRQLVPVSAIEAYHIRDLVDALPAPRRTLVEARFADVSRRVREAGLYDRAMAPAGLSAEERQDLAFAYFALQLDCPFLENELCTIYVDRPLVCREYLVTSPPAHCATPADGGIAPVNLPRLSRNVLGLGMADDAPATWPPLTLALDWVAANPDALPVQPGVAWLKAIVSRLEAAQTSPPLPVETSHPPATTPADPAAGGITLPMPSGEVPAIVMLPTFRAFTEAVVRRAIADSESQGKPVSCRAGCGTCCRHQPVPISTIEARRIAALVDAMPEPRRTEVRSRFAAADERIRAWYGSIEAGSTAERPVKDERYASFFNAGIACPLLENDSCSIYAERPLVCREYLVTSPAENCARLEEPGVEVEALPRIFAARALDTLLSDERPPSPSRILLAQAVRWTAEHPEPEPPVRPAEQWLQRFFQRLGDRGG